MAEQEFSPEEKRSNALERFYQRKKEYDGKFEKAIRSPTQQYVGAPMIYACRYCGKLDIKHELFNPKKDPVQNPCSECAEMLSNGWMPT
jgi:hypothetical protein